jgi:dihydrofolate reductase
VAKVIVGMTMSQDGFVADQNGSAGPLYPDQAVQVVGGASVVQQVLRAGLADEVHVDVMPVLLGSGLRLFANSGIERLRLEKIGVQGVGARTSLRFRVAK